MSFHNQLRSEKNRLGLTLADLSTALDVSQRTIEHWLKGDRVPALVTQEGVIARLQRLKPKSP